MKGDQALSKQFMILLSGLKTKAETISPTPYTVIQESKQQYSVCSTDNPVNTLYRIRIYLTFFYRNLPGACSVYRICRINKTYAFQIGELSYTT